MKYVILYKKMFFHYYEGRLKKPYPSDFYCNTFITVSEDVHQIHIILPQFIQTIDISSN